MYLTSDWFDADQARSAHSIDSYSGCPCVSGNKSNKKAVKTQDVLNIVAGNHLMEMGGL